MRETLDVAGAADFLKMSKDTVMRKARNGTIPGAKIGKHWVFVTKDLIETIRGEYPCQYTNQKDQATITHDSASAVKKLESRVAQLTGEKPRNTREH